MFPSLVSFWQHDDQITTTLVTETAFCCMLIACSLFLFIKIMPNSPLLSIISSGLSGWVKPRGVKRPHFIFFLLKSMPSRKKLTNWIITSASRLIMPSILKSGFISDYVVQKVGNKNTKHWNTYRRWSFSINHFWHRYWVGFRICAYIFSSLSTHFFTFSKYLLTKVTQKSQVQSFSWLILIRMINDE